MLRIGQFIPLTKLPRNLGCFDYQVSDEVASRLTVGQIIKIPFAKRSIWACFTGFIDKSNFDNPKTIEQLETLGTLDKFQFLFLNWFSSYHYYSLGSTFKLMQPELPQKIQTNLKAKKNATEYSKIEFKKSEQSQKIAEEIVHKKQKKYWLADFNIEAKWSLYIELIKKTTDQIFIFFPEVAMAQSFFQSLPVEMQKTACLAISESMKTKNRAFNVWSDIKDNKCKLVVGTRSTCFYLTQNVGTIIIDRADSDDYKQWDQAPYYDSVRVLQNAQALIGNKLIVTSTKPRIEDTAKFKEENYQYIALGRKKKVNITIVDMKKEQKRKFFFLSFQAEETIDTCIQKKQQVLLIVNKVGLFSKLVCADCGYEAFCEKCDLPFSVNEKNELECRHCQLVTKTPTVCPKCGSIKLQGRGAGLTQVKNELNKEYTCSENLNDPNAQILLSTGQYIETAHFNTVASIVFVYFDNLIYLTDFNSNYKLYSFVQNIIEKSKEQQKIIIQTHFPDNEVFKFINNDYSFLYNNEIAARKTFNYPPFCTLIKLFYQHHDKKICSNEAQRLYLELSPRIIKLGGSCSEPYLYYLNKIRKRYRYILTIKLPPMSLEDENNLLCTIPDFWSIDKNPSNLL